MIQHGDGAFTLKSGRHGERKLRDQLRLRAAPACLRHIQNRIAAVDVPTARMIIASLTLVLEPRPTAGAGGQARRLNVAELARAWRFVELSRPLARGAQFIRARQHAGAQEDRMEVDPPLLARGGSAAVWGQTACWLGLLSLSQTLSCQ